MKREVRGEVYIGVVIAIGIFVLLSQAVILLANTGYELVGYTRARNVARELASEKIEYIRNLPFDSVGTNGGIPSGPIAQTETISRNGQQYVVQTTVLYVDDPFDETAPNDMVPNDYKRARVDVTWTGFGPQGNVTTLVTDIAPKGIEELIGGGTISLLVFDSEAQPVSGATISVTSTGLTPAVNLNVMSNDNGRIVIPGAPACVKCYSVTVTKSGYSEDRTYTTSEVANPIKPSLTVLEGGLSEMSFTIDRVSNVTFRTFDGPSTGYAPLPSQTLKVRGSKTIGTDTLDNPVYKYDEDIVTNAQSEILVPNLEWDLYTITLPTSSTREIAAINPTNPIILAPGANLSVLVSIPTKVPSSLRLSFKNAIGEYIASVSAQLKDNQTLVASGSSGLTGEVNFGQLFFNALTSKDYLLEASASGYQPVSSTVTVGTSTHEEVTLTP